MARPAEILSSFFPLRRRTAPPVEAPQIPRLDSTDISKALYEYSLERNNLDKKRDLNYKVAPNDVLVLLESYYKDTGTESDRVLVENTLVAVCTAEKDEKFAGPVIYLIAPGLAYPVAEGLRCQRISQYASPEEFKAELLKFTTDRYHFNINIRPVQGSRPDLYDRVKDVFLPPAAG